MSGNPLDHGVKQERNQTKSIMMEHNVLLDGARNPSINDKLAIIM